jgi:hypothetical protein
LFQKVGAGAKFQKFFQNCELIPWETDLRKSPAEEPAREEDQREKSELLDELNKLEKLDKSLSHTQWFLAPYCIGMKLHSLRTEKRLTLARLAAETDEPSL